MALLPDSDRVAVWAQWMRDNKQGISIVKADLRAAVNATDQWIDDNAASFNSALPVAARTTLTARQKAMLLNAVMERRFNLS